jgi:serine/threonine-protein kinase
VERRVVRRDDEIWLLLGEVIEGYKPIIFRDGRFRVTNAAYAAYPVLRVTGFGASAYAHFYGRRLPTAVEWIYAAKKGRSGRNNPPPTGSGSSSGMQMGWMMENWSQEQKSTAHKSDPRELKALQNLESVLSFPPNAFGIRGMNADIGEWAFLLPGSTSRSESGDAEYVILGGIETVAEKDSPIPSFVIRQPWESFEEVGFRCVRGVRIQPAE